MCQNTFKIRIYLAPLCSLAMARSLLCLPGASQGVGPTLLSPVLCQSPDPVIQTSVYMYACMYGPLLFFCFRRCCSRNIAQPRAKYCCILRYCAPQAIRRSQPKRRVLGQELVQAPQAHALLPILVVPHDTDCPPWTLGESVLVPAWRSPSVDERTDCRTFRTHRPV